MPHSLSRLKHSSMIFFIIVQMFTWVLCIPQNFLRNLFLGETCLWPFLNTSREFYNTGPTSDDKRDVEETMINCKSRTLQKFRNKAKKIDWIFSAQDDLKPLRRKLGRKNFYFQFGWEQEIKKFHRNEKMDSPVAVAQRLRRSNVTWAISFSEGFVEARAWICPVKVSG